jgi:hypothetical protein
MPLRSVIDGGQLMILSRRGLDQAHWQAFGIDISVNLGKVSYILLGDHPLILNRAPPNSQGRWAVTVLRLQCPLCPRGMQG